MSFYRLVAGLSPSSDTCKESSNNNPQSTNNNNQRLSQVRKRIRNNNKKQPRVALPIDSDDLPDPCIRKKARTEHPLNFVVKNAMKKKKDMKILTPEFINSDSDSDSDIPKEHLKKEINNTSTTTTHTITSSSTLTDNTPENIVEEPENELIDMPLTLGEPADPSQLHDDLFTTDSEPESEDTTTITTSSARDSKPEPSKPAIPENTSPILTTSLSNMSITSNQSNASSESGSDIKHRTKTYDPVKTSIISEYVPRPIIKSKVVIPTYVATPVKTSQDASTQTTYHPKYYERAVLAKDVLKQYYYAINNIDQDMAKNLQSYMEKVGIFRPRD